MALFSIERFVGLSEIGHEYFESGQSMFLSEDVTMELSWR